jgi:hypothetical protein
MADFPKRDLNGRFPKTRTSSRCIGSAPRFLVLISGIVLVVRPRYNSRTSRTWIGAFEPVTGRDIRGIERCDQSCYLVEECQLFGVVGELIGQNHECSAGLNCFILRSSAFDRTLHSKLRSSLCDITSTGIVNLAMRALENAH